MWLLSKLVSDHPNVIASLAIVGAGIAVALQDIVKDIVGWIIVLQRRLYTLGDRVSIGNHTGDVIEIQESKPISKTKNWVATRLVEKAAEV